MQNIELVLGLLVAVAALVTVARRLDIPYPILLVVGGLVLGFIPRLPQVELSPDLVFLLFLPPLLFWGALNTSRGSHCRTASTLKEDHDGPGR